MVGMQVIRAKFVGKLQDQLPQLQLVRTPERAKRNDWADLDFVKRRTKKFQTVYS